MNKKELARYINKRIKETQENYEKPNEELV